MTYDKDDHIKRLEARVDLLESVVAQKVERIKELKDGACRFNCRTARDAYIAGYELAHGWGLTDREKELLGNRFFAEWVKK